ncbi:uncharacterized protein LOC144558548 [Carex rostrata]
MVFGGLTRWNFMEVWHARAPSKVKFFTYLMLQERTLTRDVLARRGIPCQLQCEMCRQGQQETGLHLMYTCTYADQVWRTIEGKRGIKMRQGSTSIQETWSQSWNIVRSQGLLSKSEWVVRKMAVLWGIWRQRNEQIFRGKSLPSNILAERVWEEGELWLKCCGEGKK